MKVGIIGMGFVGLSLGVVLADKEISIVGIDSNKEIINSLKNGQVYFHEKDLKKYLKKGLEKKIELYSEYSKLDKCDFIFICVGTPQKNNGSIDTSMIENVAKNIGIIIRKSNKKHFIIVKSTVIPGTTEKLKSIIERNSKKREHIGFEILTNPEFLRESQAIHDTLNPHIIVIGGNNNFSIKRMSNFYKKLHQKTPIIETNFKTAELIKYANNSFLATKISFINQISNICEKISGVNIDDISKSIGLDPRIGNQFLMAGPGYGGSCLPKDVKAIITFSKKLGINPKLLASVEKINEQQLKNLINKINYLCGELNSKKITILGLSFKPETDDIRDSISIELIKLLLKQKAKIFVHDPRAINNVRKVFGDKISYCNSILDALKNSEMAVIMTGWSEYSKIENKDINVMKSKNIIDTRRILTKKKLNCKYYSLGFTN